MTLLTRPMVLKVLRQIRENGGRLNRSAITRELLKNYPASVIDKSLQYEMAKLITTETVKRKGICRPIQDWVLLPDGYRELGASVPNEVKPTPAAPASKTAPAVRIQPPQMESRPIPAAPVLKPAAPQMFQQIPQPPDFEPGMVPPVRMPVCMPEPVRVLPPNREDVLEITDGRLLYYDGTPAELTPEQLREKTAGTAERRGNLADGLTLRA